MRKLSEELMSLFGMLPVFVRQHCIQVAEYTGWLTEQAQKSGRYPCLEIANLCWDMEWAALWHDIGKACVSDSLWESAFPLEGEEKVLVRAHPILGASLLEGKIELKSPGGAWSDQSRLTRDACLYHHEKWNGTGYPFGLQGEEIPLAARLVAIADTFDSMISVRPYTRPKTTKAALEEVKRCAGKQFDPELAQIFIDGWTCEGSFSEAL